MIMSFAISQSTFFIMAMTQERFFAFGTDEVLNVEMLSQCSNNTFFDRPTTCSANRDSHPIMTTQAIKLVHIVSGKSSAALNLASR